MLVKEGYHKIYYQKNKEKSKSNFQKWYTQPGNKEKMKNYMRNYMRKKKGINKKDYRRKD